MAEFLANLVRGRKVTGNRAEELSWLRWICIQGTYVFAASDPALRAEQRRFVEICGCLAATFAVIVDDPEGVLDLCGLVFALDRSKEPALDEALVENHLRGWKDWRDAYSPIGWVKDRAEHIHECDHTQGGYIREADALYRTPTRRRDGSAASLAFDYQDTARDVIPLEEVSDLPLGVAGMSLQPRYTWMSVERLEAAIRDDGDLSAYAQLRHRGWKRRHAWTRLGWQAKRGEAVDRRYRRLLEKIRASGFEYQNREIEMVGGLSDASCTVVKERLRIPVDPTSEGTLSGRVVYEPRLGGFERSH
jgi:hypothetical protein